ncbi:hypothetical protein DB30_04699 [Enhygromyxa salina]|uniref:Endo-1,4-beta-xylanase A n=1 Tax=Enhygromyxa salina TaxID=215803 RepID=A0A0C1ZP17_9BACT|nr:hypothetical protein [Enhygromyxa salina]KIG19234.1 hypothetical protein DB30_04699 [Enhygromyxa salina]
MTARSSLYLTLSGTLGFFVGCGGAGSDDSDCQPGTYLCECLSGICQVGLVCTGTVCVNPTGGDDTTGPGDGDGDGDTGPTGPGDGDGDTGPGDGDGDTGPTGDGDGDTGPTGDGDGDGDLDDDADGIPNNQDNCPSDYNPNQLDFDNKGGGNVCDVLEFTTVTGTLQTTWVTNAVFIDCEEPVSWVVTGGSVSVQLDDDAAVASFEINTLEIADFSAVCDDFVTAEFVFDDPSVNADGPAFPVDVNHSFVAHNNGTISGSSDAPHPMLLLSDGQINIINQRPTMANWMLQGQLWTFNANITGGGSSGTLSWNAPNVETTYPEVIVIQTVDFEVYFKGLSGTLNLAP